MASVDSSITIRFRLPKFNMPAAPLPTYRTQFTYHAFHCSVPSIWNSLDSYIVDSCSLSVFKYCKDSGG